MNTELQEKIMKECPLLYRDKDLGPRQTLMCFGIEPGDGWFALIMDLSKNLERLIRKQSRWWKRLYCWLRRYPCYRSKAVQVMEKYGALRLYLSFGTQEMHDLIDKAEEVSEVTCEVCGKPGALTWRGGWLVCRCEACGRKNGN